MCMCVMFYPISCPLVYVCVCVLVGSYCLSWFQCHRSRRRKKRRVHFNRKEQLLHRDWVTIGLSLTLLRQNRWLDRFFLQSLNVKGWMVCCFFLFLCPPSLVSHQIHRETKMNDETSQEIQTEEWMNESPVLFFPTDSSAWVVWIHLCLELQRFGFGCLRYHDDDPSSLLSLSLRPVICLSLFFLFHVGDEREISLSLFGWWWWWKENKNNLTFLSR